MTTHDCIVLKYKNLVFVVRLGPEINVEDVSDYY